MTDDKQPKTPATHRPLDTFEPGAGSGPIEDHGERERRIALLPAGEKALAEESARFADLCQYFSQHQMDIPAHIVDEFGGISKLTVEARIAVMKRLNQALMEYLNAVGQDPGIRQ